MSATDDRPPEQLREAFLLGYPGLGPGYAAHLVRRALADRAEHARTARQRRARRAAAGLAGVLAALVIGALVLVRLGGLAAHLPVEGTTPPPGRTPAPAAAIVYVDGLDPTHLRRVGYDGRPMFASLLLPAQVVSVSPDGAYVVTLRQDWLIFDAGGQVVSTVPLTPGQPAFGAWADDSRRVCRVAIGNSLRWQVVVTDVLAAGGPGVAVPVSGLTYPPYITIAACNPAAGRAVLIVPLTDAVPAPDAERAALVVDLSTGAVLTRVSLGDPGHGVVFSSDGRYLASIDYERGTSAIVSLVTGKTVRVESGEVRGFSADDSRVVENSRFEPLTGDEVGTTRVVDWRSGRVLYSQQGWTNAVRSQPGGAAVAMDVMLTALPADQGGPTDVVIVPASGADILFPNATIR